jgi:hypothetical protein
LRSLRRILLCILLVALHTLVAWPAPGPVPAHAANPTIFSTNFDSQSAGALTTGSDPNLFTSTTGGSNLSVQTATYNSSPNALSVNVAGGGSFYAEKDYLTHYLQHELSWHLYLGADFTIATGSYLVLAKLLPSSSTSVGKVNVVLSDSNTIRIDYVDSTGTQHYLYGNPVSKGAWHPPRRALAQCSRPDNTFPQTPALPRCVRAH